MKTRMKMCNRAWRNVTKSYGWHEGWKKGRKQWKAFCRQQAEQTAVHNFEDICCYADAESFVMEEISYWD